MAWTLQPEYTALWRRRRKYSAVVTLKVSSVLSIQGISYQKLGWKVFSTSRDLEFQFDDRRRERLTDKKDTVEPKVAWEKLARGRRRRGKAVAVNG